MPRVASLYLPNLATDRIRRLERTRRAAPPPKSSPPIAKAEEDEGGWWPDARWPENAKERAKLLALREHMASEEADGAPRPELEHGSHWRPGARWAKDSDEWLEQRIVRKRAKRDAIQAEIDELPLHQRPSIREMGRRSEAMPHPFRPMPPDEAARSGERVSPYNLEGAFWQQGRTLGPMVAREVVKSSPASPGEGDHAKHGGGAADDSRAASPPACGWSPSPWEDIPLVTTRRDGQRIVIAAACPLALALGLTPGMPLTQARALIPGLDVRPADPDGVVADLRRLATHAARHWTPLVTIVPEEAGGGGLWLDIGASAHLFGGEAGFARRLLGLCRRLGFSAGSRSPTRPPPRMRSPDAPPGRSPYARPAGKQTRSPPCRCPPSGSART
jgi:protein ImuB